mmetsp:Transcript_52905/g.84322  ORF Transcript_52905/g.84322 Transcript_52905/m.84322 type:complete len:629 (+) Transcript_52905:632-2518(+)
MATSWASVVKRASEQESATDLKMSESNPYQALGLLEMDATGGDRRRPQGASYEDFLQWLQTTDIEQLQAFRNATDDAIRERLEEKEEEAGPEPPPQPQSRQEHEKEQEEMQGGAMEEKEEAAKDHVIPVPRLEVHESEQDRPQQRLSEQEKEQKPEQLQLQDDVEDEAAPDFFKTMLEEEHELHSEMKTDNHIAIDDGVADGLQDDADVTALELGDVQKPTSTAAIAGDNDFDAREHKFLLTETESKTDSDDDDYIYDADDADVYEHAKALQAAVDYSHSAVKSTASKPVIAAYLEEYVVNDEYKDDCHKNGRSTSDFLEWAPYGRSQFRKHQNPAKGTVFISKSATHKIANSKLVKETFNTEIRNDDKLIFKYLRESISIQIHDGITQIIHTDQGDIVLFHVDLHDVDGNDLYLVALQNDADWRRTKGVDWQITHLLPAAALARYSKMGWLPTSSRHKFWRSTPMPSIQNQPFRELGLKKKNLKKLQQITYKGNDEKYMQTLLHKVVPIKHKDLKYCIAHSFVHPDPNVKYAPLVPTLFIDHATGRQWLEWKKFVNIRDDQWFAVSLRFNQALQRWDITALDFDLRRIYEKHRLLGLDDSHPQSYTYNQLVGYVTISALNVKGRGSI